MNLLQNIIEFGVISYACLFVFRIFRRGLFRMQIIACLSFFTVLAGEIVNSYVTRVTAYNDSFILWVPGTGIPLFIIAGGILLSSAIFLFAQILSRSFLEKLDHSLKCIFLIFLLSIPLPLLERAGIGLGLWRWLKPAPYDFDWYLGVWLFYSVFVVLPAYLGVLVFRIKYGRNAPSLKTGQNVGP